MSYSPIYYQLNLNGIDCQVKDLINSANYSYNLGTAISYLIRSGRKRNNTIDEDVTKAICHLRFEEEKLIEYPQWFVSPSLMKVKGKFIPPNAVLHPLGMQSSLDVALGYLLTLNDCDIDQYLTKIELAGNLLSEFLTK
jgi:hypothetical protein